MSAIEFVTLSVNCLVLSSPSFGVGKMIVIV